MKVLVVGGGGREHALAWRLAQDPAVTHVLAAPGNAGIAAIAECFPDTAADDVNAVVNVVDQQDVDLTIVGPEAPLVAGLADALRSRGRAVFGPSATAARIEGSKAFAKDIMTRRGVPTARAGAFEDVEKSVAFLDELGGRGVIKADGLAAGKGVTVATERGAAVAAIEACLVGGAFGTAGSTIVVEELLEGPEVSVFAITDGTGACVLLDVAADHKRIGDDDTGPNTGGMGAYSPVPSISQALATEILDTCITPVVEELAPYRGVLFAGMMLTADGPKVLEYNCRFGDPETQVLLPRTSYQLGTLLHACATGTLANVAEPVALDEGAAVTVVLASAGYPGTYPTGRFINGLDEAAAIEGVTVFHAGTARNGDGEMVTAGGRVLDVTARGATLAEARERAYRAVAEINFEGMQFRTDIAARAAEEAR
ncbi:MAG: phosphoribosylamine--glycine ligase [Actinomycetota bacterium]